MAMALVDRAGLLNFLSDTAGSAMADEASCSATNRSVHLVAGDGGFAWFQLLWPHVDVAMSGNDSFAFHKPGQATQASDTARRKVWQRAAKEE